MAQRRMFALAVIDTDRFNDMSISARLLYYELGMRADDDGFVSSPKKIIKMCGCSQDDLRLLIEKEFVICFSSGVIVITDWKLSNSVPADRYHKTIYQEEFAQLEVIDKVYSLSAVSNLDTSCIQSVPKTDTQVRLGKVRLDKDSEDILSAPADERAHFDYQSVVDSFNSVCVSLPKVKKLTDKRRKAIKKTKSLLDDLSFEDYFTMVEQSDFLTGRGENDWQADFDWILKPSKLIKVIEGSYANKTAAKTTTQPRNYDEEF